MSQANIDAASVFSDMTRSRQAGRPVGITSVCSAHPLVIEAALRRGVRDGGPVLIEATCNQVNQEGGYTGMTPADFVAFVHGIARQVGFDTANLLLGGDHMGPNPWRRLDAEVAMERAEAMVAAYAAAGFGKIHLDASMGCAGEPEALDDEVTAARAVRLVRAAEVSAAAAGRRAPVYIIGTEVPSPGGARHGLDGVEPTDPAAARTTIATHRDVFEAVGLRPVFRRVIGLVVQPGVEFGHESVVRYDPAKGAALARVLDTEPGLVFEAHSTDYQPASCLAALVRDGSAILKVGPGLTFAMREALYALDLIASELDPAYGVRPLVGALESAMQARPSAWQPYYPGTPAERHVLRHYSYSDRLRYYWSAPDVAAAVERLFTTLAGRSLPPTLLGQFVPGWASDDPATSPHGLVLAAIDRVLAAYAAACQPEF